MLPGLLAELVKQCTLRGVFVTGGMESFCGKAQAKAFADEARHLEAMDIIESSEEHDD